MIGRTIQEIEEGDFYEEKVLIDENTILQYANVTGDHNPLHEDEEYAKKTIFGSRICHGMLIGGYFSKILGTKLPGEGCIYQKQVLSFLKPIYIGENVTLRIEVVEKNLEKNRIMLLTQCFNENDELCVTGNATVLPRK